MSKSNSGPTAKAKPPQQNMTSADHRHHQLLDPLVLSYLPTSTVGAVLPQVSKTFAEDSSRNAYWRPVFEAQFRGSAAYRCLLKLELERQHERSNKSNKRQKGNGDEARSEKVSADREAKNRDKKPASPASTAPKSKRGFDMDGNQWKTAFRIVHSSVQKAKAGTNDDDEDGLPPPMQRTGNLTSAELDELLEASMNFNEEMIHRADEIIEGENRSGFANLPVKTQRMLQDFISRVSRACILINEGH